MHDALYHALDIKNKAVIELTCPEVELDGLRWYDTTDYGFIHERFYLLSRGLIAIHPVNTQLVRFPSYVPPLYEKPVPDPRRLLRT